jgi:hypothetical protein
VHAAVSGARTAPLGALLLTGYLGGATAIQVRIEDAWFLFPAAVGDVGWRSAVVSEFLILSSEFHVR